MVQAKEPTEISVYQIKVTLTDIRPPIWRRILVTSDTRLPKLHSILQVVMGWWDYHLHLFNMGGTDYGEPDPDFYDDMRNEKNVRLAQVVLGEKFKFIYEYDFGDSWDHELLVEKILPPEPNVSYPICLKGKRACPPEDCGGPWGYAGFLEAINDPEHPDHEGMLEWIGGSFDPEAFDLEDINAKLKTFQRRKARSRG